MTTPTARTADTGGIAGEQLRAIVDRIQRLNEEKKALNADISDVFKEAKGNGFHVPTIKQIIKIMNTDRNELDEAETLLSVYMSALGLLPPGEYASEREAA